MLPFASCSTYVRVPCRTPARPVANLAAWRPAASDFSAGFHADQANGCVGNERVEDAERIASTPHACDDRVG